MNPEPFSNTSKEMTTNPDTHVQHVHKMMNDLVMHLEEDVDQMNDPRALALFETSKEVLKGLMKAFDDYEGKNEKAWKSNK